MGETVWDVLSVRDENGTPYYNNCSVTVADTVVVFDQGVSRVPEHVAAILAGSRHVRVPGFTGPAATPPQSVEDDAAVAAPGDGAAEREDALAAQLAEDAEILGEAGSTEPTSSSKAALTDDGRPRCQALKADSTQCANAATEGNACGLATHRAQLT